MPSATVREIHPEVLYPLEEIKRRTGLGNWALRSARKNGLKVIYKNGKAWVMGKDFIAYMTKPEPESTLPDSVSSEELVPA